MSVELSSPVEYKGDIASQADVDSFEQYIPIVEATEEDEFSAVARRVASKILGEYPLEDGQPIVLGGGPDAVEYDGDVIPVDDARTLEEQRLYGSPEPEEGVPTQTTPLETGNVRKTEAFTPEEAARIERAYDEAAATVETKEDQGIDGTAAWAQVDPSGKIRHNFALLEESRERR